MFDHMPTAACDESLTIARHLFFDLGHDLAEAASRLGGACGEAKVVACALQIEAASQMTNRIRRELTALHRLLSLDAVGDPDCLETELFSSFDPAGPEVEKICLLTDRLEGLIEEVDFDLARRAAWDAATNTIAS